VVLRRPRRGALRRLFRLRPPALGLRELSEPRPPGSAPGRSLAVAAPSKRGAQGPARSGGGPMTRWEYCDATWQPTQVVLTHCTANGSPRVQTFDAEAWPQLLARLGADGWELVSTTAAPTGVHEYYFYFKRPLS